MAFDTLKASESLAAAGIAEPHAKAIAGTMRDAVTEGVATKSDIARLETDLAAMEARMTWRVVGLVAGANALLFAALRLTGG